METGKILELADDIIYDSYLLQKHKMETSDEVDQFDIANLIDKGEAINVNTLTYNPYDSRTNKKIYNDEVKSESTTNKKIMSYKPIYSWIYDPWGKG